MALMLLYAGRVHVSALRLAGQETQARVLSAAAQQGLETALTEAGTLLHEAAPAFDPQGWMELPGPAADLDDGIRIRTVLRNRGLIPSSMELIEIESHAGGGGGGARAVRQQARLHPWLPHPPPAPLIVGGDADLPGMLELVNDEGSVLAWSGGPFSAPAGALRLAAEPRCPPAGVCEGDARLAALQRAEVFRNFFARDPLSLRAVAAGSQSVVWTGNGSGAVPLGDATFGSADAPVALIIDGDLELTGSVSIDGLLYVHGDWLHGPGSIEIRGAMIVAGSAHHRGPARLHYRSDRLARLAETGVYARIAGSWNDF